jgi:hypothetical protein
VSDPPGRAAALEEHDGSHVPSVMPDPEPKVLATLRVKLVLLGARPGAVDSEGSNRAVVFPGDAGPFTEALMVFDLEPDQELPDHAPGDDAELIEPPGGGVLVRANGIEIRPRGDVIVSPRALWYAESVGRSTLTIPTRYDALSRWSPARQHPHLVTRSTWLPKRWAREHASAPIVLALITGACVFTISRGGRLPWTMIYVMPPLVWAAGEHVRRRRITRATRTTKRDDAPYRSMRARLWWAAGSDGAAQAWVTLYEPDAGPGAAPVISQAVVGVPVSLPEGVGVEVRGVVAPGGLLRIELQDGTVLEPADRARAWFPSAPFTPAP